MGVIETVKDVGILIQKLDNLELLKRMVELQEQVYELVNENREIKDQNRTLKEKLALRDEMRFRKKKPHDGSASLGPPSSGGWPKNPPNRPPDSGRNTGRSDRPSGWPVITSFRDA